MKKKFVFFIGLLLFFCTLYSAIVVYGIKVYSSVDKHYIGIDEQVMLRITLAGVGFFSDLKIPKMDDFSFIKLSQFTGSDFSSGRPVPYTVFEYMLTPLRKGDLIIPKVYVAYKGLLYSSEEYKIKVVDKVRKVEQDEESKNFSISSTSIKNLGKFPIFIRSSISNNKVFYNQQIIYTYTIFTRIPIKKLPIIEIPEFVGFRREKLYTKKEYLTRINGVLHKAFEYKFALFPYMTDNQKISKIKMLCKRDIFVTNGDIDRFLGNNKYAVFETNDFNVEVIPLPIKDKPLNFSGLIGDFDITCEVENKEINLDDNLVVFVRIKGSGNITSIPTIKTPFISGLNEYENNSFVNFDKKESRIVGEKIFKFTYVPIRHGEVKIPSIGFSYFDENLGEYKTKFTSPIDVKISKNKNKDKKDNSDNQTERDDTKKSKKLYKKLYFLLFPIILIVFLFNKKYKK